MDEKYCFELTVPEVEREGFRNIIQLGSRNMVFADVAKILPRLMTVTAGGTRCERLGVPGPRGEGSV